MLKLFKQNTDIQVIYMLISFLSAGCSLAIIGGGNKEVGKAVFGMLLILGVYIISLLKFLGVIQ